MDEVQKRNYRGFLVAEGILLVETFGAVRLLIHAQDAPGWWPIFVSMLWVWHVVAIPICILYLIGKPMVMSLAPLIDSPESRAYRRELRERTVLSDEEFHARYYRDTEISFHVSGGVRRALTRSDRLFQRAIPSDRIYLLSDDLDIVETLHDVEEEFAIRFSKENLATLDGTLDNVIHLVHRRIYSVAPGTSSTA